MAWRRKKWIDRLIARQDGAKKPKKANPFAPYANSWERATAVVLEAERQAGKWVRVHYNRCSFSIVPKVDESTRAVSYLPDFTLLDHDGRIAFVECKGHMRPGAENKIKGLREMFPTVPIYISYLEKGVVKFIQYC